MPIKLLYMTLTNLRSRPLSDGHIESMHLSNLSLYHHRSQAQRTSLWLHSGKSSTQFKSWAENTKLPRFMLKPAALMVPPAGGRSLHLRNAWDCDGRLLCINLWALGGFSILQVNRRDYCDPWELVFASGGASSPLVASCTWAEGLLLYIRI